MPCSPGTKAAIMAANNNYLQFLKTLCASCFTSCIDNYNKSSGACHGSCNMGGLSATQQGECHRNCEEASRCMERNCWGSRTACEANIGGFLPQIESYCRDLALCQCTPCAQVLKIGCFAPPDPCKPAPMAAEPTGVPAPGTKP